MEIERKFLLTHLPPLEPFRVYETYQGYLSTEPEVRFSRSRVVSETAEGTETEIKTGAETEKYKMTVKGSGTLSREEYKTIVPVAFFRDIAAFIGKPFIHKDYYLYHVGGRTLECSIVDAGSPTEFIYGEVEFENEEEAKAFAWPFEGAEDVTYKESYKMKEYWKRTRGV